MERSVASGFARERMRWMKERAQSSIVAMRLRREWKASNTYRASAACLFALKRNVDAQVF